MWIYTYDLIEILNGKHIVLKIMSVRAYTHHLVSVDLGASRKNRAYQKYDEQKSAFAMRHLQDICDRSFKLTAKVVFYVKRDGIFKEFS